MNRPLNPSEIVAALTLEGDRQLTLQAPLAAWASWQRALRIDPDCQAAIEGLDAIEAAITWPSVARLHPKFRNPQGDDRRKRWDHALRGKDMTEVALAFEAFAELAKADPSDAEATFNSALCLAWQARNIAAIDQLSKYVELTAPTDFTAATEAWTFAELLRHADDAAAVADDVSFAYMLNGPLMPDGLPGAIRPIEFVSTTEETAPGLTKGSRVFEWLTQIPSGTEPATLLATFVVGPTATRIFSPDAELLPKAWEILKQGHDLSRFTIEMIASPLKIELSDIDVWTIRTDPELDHEVGAEIRRQHVERFYETRWMARERNGLGSEGTRATPLQASRGDLASKARLAGVIQFREQLAERPAVMRLYGGYRFDRLRKRLGLETNDPNFSEVEEVALLSERELETLDPTTLDDSKLAEAFESAAALGDDTRTSRFAAELVKRDATALGGIDRHALFAVLVRQAVAANDLSRALRRLDEAVEADAKHGGGRQRLIFLAWRAELLCRMGEPDKSLSVYHEVLAEAPASHAPELALDAAEMLEDNEHLDQALAMARHALSLAIEQNDGRIEGLVREMLAELE